MSGFFVKILTLKNLSCRVLVFPRLWHTGPARVFLRYRMRGGKFQNHTQRETETMSNNSRSQDKNRGSQNQGQQAQSQQTQSQSNQGQQNQQQHGSQKK